MSKTSIITKIVYFFIIILTTLSCKKPKAEFKLLSFEYEQGDVIDYDNFSENYHSALWDVLTENDEIVQSFDEKNPTIITKINGVDGVYKLRLTTFNKLKTKEAITEETFILKSVKERLVINNSGVFNGGESDYEVFIDNQLVGNSNHIGQFDIYLPVGSRLIKLVSPNKTLEKVYNFTSSTVFIKF